MSNERFAERLVERMLEGLTLLTRQVSRVAGAIETIIISEAGDSELEDFPCPHCGSNILIKGRRACIACNEPFFPKDPH